ncbi:MAG: hypothetical protein CBB71_02825 [Rhodopirellula sp. TMED11]|nr:MAG: hypothetical protein CBB71_02825 [Rhodopirellula sp. TMED11]
MQNKPVGSTCTQFVSPESNEDGVSSCRLLDSQVPRLALKLPQPPSITLTPFITKSRACDENAEIASPNHTHRAVVASELPRQKKIPWQAQHTTNVAVCPQTSQANARTDYFKRRAIAHEHNFDRG